MDFQSFSLSPNIELNLLALKKFKKISLRLFFFGPLNDQITPRALLPYVLKRASATYPTFESLQNELEKLYGASLGANAIKIGETHGVIFSMTWPNELFLPGKPSITPKVLQILSDALYKPLLEHGKFIEASVASERDHLKNFILGRINEKSSYGHFQLLQQMFPQEAYRKDPYGEIEALSALDSASLSKFYQDFIPANPLSIYVVGNIQVDQWREWVTQAFPTFEPRPLSLPPIERRACRTSPQEVTEKLPLLNQSHLFMGFRSAINYQEGDFYGLMVANALLGSFPHSKLFLKIREEKGLVYSVYSSVDLAKGFLLIYGGLDEKNRSLMQSMAMEQLEEIQKGRISDFEWKSTLAGVVNGLRSVQDNPAQWTYFALAKKFYYRGESLEEEMEQIQKVDKERIAQAAQSLQLDTVYFLTGQK